MLAGVLLVACTNHSAFAQFQNFTPVASSLPALPVNSPGEATPFVFGNAGWTQTSIASRSQELGQGEFNTGNWDMIDTNRSGVDAGRYLFTVFETSGGGIMRYDRQTQSATTVWNGTIGSFASNPAIVLDASRWTPHGTYLTAEESWAVGGASTKGRLFELTNPTTATTGTGLVTHQNAVARVSHEGLAFDTAKNMYYIDELNGGSIYKFTSADPNNTGTGYFSGGVNSVLRVGTGFTANATGASTWVPFTDATGAGLAGAVTVTPAGIPAVDGRATTDVAAFKGTDYQRPEDLEIETLGNGDQLLYVATTTTNEVYSLNITTGVMSVFVNQTTLNLGTGLAVGSAFTSPDNLAIDSLGNIYIIEDQPGGVANIWFANDVDNNGIAESISNWATMLTAGAEPTGLYFDIFDPNLAYVNVQHPTSGNDRLIEIAAVPEPATLLWGAALGLVAGARRNRSRRNAPAA